MKNKIKYLLSLLLMLVLVIQLTTPVSFAAEASDQTIEGDYVITLNGTNLALTAENDRNGGNVSLQAVNSDNTAQQWRIIPVSGGGYKLLNLAAYDSIRLLDVAGNGSSAANGMNLQIWEANSESANTQIFHFSPVENGYRIVSDISDEYCLDAQGSAASIRAGSNIQLWSIGSRDSGTQIFTLKPVGEEAFDMVEVTRSKAPLRKAPAKASDNVFLELEPGDCLRAVAYEKNSAGNYWYKISYGGSHYYIYEKNVKAHKHNLKELRDGLSICKCGYYIVKHTGMTNTSAALPVEVGYLEADALAAAASAASAAVSAAGAVALPYLIGAVLVIGSVYLVVQISQNVTLTQVDIDATISNSTTADDIEQYNGKYYPCISRKDKTNGDCLVLINLASEMTCKEAEEYLEEVANRIDNRPASLLQGLPIGYAMTGIWTSKRSDASALCSSFVAVDPENRSFGTSVDPSEEAERNQSDSCYCHFHLWRNNPLNDNPALEKLGIRRGPTAHIFFGLSTSICNPTVPKV